MRGYAVLGCEGPEASDDRCPLTVGKESPEWRALMWWSRCCARPTRTREVLIEIKRHRADLPVVVEVAAPTVDRRTLELFEDCRILPQPMTAGSLLEAVSLALAG